MDKSRTRTFVYIFYNSSIKKCNWLREKIVNEKKRIEKNGRELPKVEKSKIVGRGKKNINWENWCLESGFIFFFFFYNKLCLLAGAGFDTGMSIWRPVEISVKKIHVSKNAKDDARAEQKAVVESEARLKRKKKPREKGKKKIVISWARKSWEISRKFCSVSFDGEWTGNNRARYNYSFKLNKFLNKFFIQLTSNGKNKNSCRYRPQKFILTWIKINV